MSEGEISHASLRKVHVAHMLRLEAAEREGGRPREMAGFFFVVFFFSLTPVNLRPTAFLQRQLGLSCAVGRRPFQVSFL